jgi:SAM-dependent methyltransferase
MTSNPHRELYDGIAEWYVRTFYSDFSDEDWLGLIARSMVRGGIVADVGCGPGQFAAFFRRLGHCVLSMDLSSRMLAVGRRIDQELHPVVADIARLPLADRSTQALLAAYTLEHVKEEEADSVLAEIVRVVDLAGVVALMVKCGHGFYEFKSSLVRGAGGYVQLWSLEDLASRLERLGCELILTDRKAPVSPEEFNHERGFVMVRRRSLFQAGV